MSQLRKSSSVVSQLIRTTSHRSSATVITRGPRAIGAWTLCIDIVLKLSIHWLHAQCNWSEALATSRRASLAHISAAALQIEGDETVARPRSGNGSVLAYT